LVLPFAVGFYPLRAAGAITFVWFDTKAAGLNAFVSVGAKAAVRLVGLGVIVVVS
jgi:hypothetical protein